MHSSCPSATGTEAVAPSRDYVEYALRQKDLEGGVKVKMEGPREFFEEMQEQGGPANTYVGELYFSAHRGTYTSQAMVKKNNRRCEFALREMEMWSCLAASRGWEYPLEKADALWKQLLPASVPRHPSRLLHREGLCGGGRGLYRDP